jgi:diadenosine tetraphosphate (Ap4A) HIT family hydrolase
MANPKNPVLWENEKFSIITPLNPHLPYSEGLQLVVSPKEEIANAWQKPDLAAETFKLASTACAIMERLAMAPWFNIQANGNWGLLPGSTPFFHIHIYGRNKTTNWAKPIVLPEAPKTYQNEPMPLADREKLIQAFREELGD